MKFKTWFANALLTTSFWGIWGALIEIPEKSGFPSTLGYIVWSVTMIIPAVIALRITRWKLQVSKKALLSGLLIGLLGATGQLILFQALKTGPAYLVFPFVSLSPILTVFLSVRLLKEKASSKIWTGIIVALIAIPLLSYQAPSGNLIPGYIWIVLSLFVFVLWGIQSYCIKIANEHMQAESIFFYMMISSMLLIPAAFLMTDFSQTVNLGAKGLYAAFAIQILNSVGALFSVYAFRYGRAIIVSPMINAGAPFITIVLSLLIYGVIPHPIIISGMALSIIAIFLLASPEQE